MYKFQIFIVEAVVHHDLLQERDDLARGVLVRLGEVDVFQIQNQSPGGTRPIHSAFRAVHNRTKLAELLEYVNGRGLPVAVHHGHV